MKRLIMVCLTFIIMTSSNNISWSHYNIDTKQIVCGNHSVECIHEIGHYLDHNSGWISETKEFQEYFKNYQWYGINNYAMNRNFKVTDLYSLYYKVFGWGGWREFYAENFYQYWGCENLMPESMRKFYNFEISNPLIDNLVFNTKIICPKIVQTLPIYY